MFVGMPQIVCVRVHVHSRNDSPIGLECRYSLDIGMEQVHKLYLILTPFCYTYNFAWGETLTRALHVTSEWYLALRFLSPSAGLSHREDAKLLEGLKMLAIEKRSYPLQEKLLNAKTSEEKKAIRKQIRALKYAHCVYIHVHVSLLLLVSLPNPILSQAKRLKGSGDFGRKGLA